MADKHSASESIASLDGGVAKIIKLHSPQKALRRISDLPTLLKLCENAEAFEAERAEEIEEIDVSNMGMSLGHIPPLITRVANLTSLNLSGCAITFIPFNLKALTNLKDLKLGRNQINSVPSEIADMTQLTNLDLAFNTIGKVPNEISNLCSLTTCNLMGNQLTCLPDTFRDKMPNMRLIGLKSNQLTELPPSFTSLTSLVELFITNNQLKTFPEGFSNLINLVKLQASFNKLEKIPDDLLALTKLELVRVAVCNIDALPQAITLVTEVNQACPPWPKLAWFSLGGNAICGETPPNRLGMKTIQRSELEFKEKLGDGASGEVFSACLKASDREVAVKVFRADVSPDGRTEEEVCIACAVDHPNLTRVGALVLNGDEVGSRPSLMMDIVAGTPMALKPTSEHLLRCKWSPGTTFSTTAVVKIASGVASALEYLHGMGICHGDVYAHNILVDEHYFATICDFGASFWYQKSETNFWEGMEVRAFGLFLKDLVDRIDESETKSETTPSPAHDLVDRCLNTSFNLRPAFKEIGTILASWTPVL